MTQILTLTTDFGHEDYYTGVLKGVILSINPELKIVDINHNVDRHNILSAAVNIKKSYSYFPKGTIHIVVVDPGVGSDRQPIIVQTENYIFVGPDNGVFTYIYKENSFDVYRISNKEYFLDNVSVSFHARDIFAPVAAHISILNDPKIFGEKIDSPTSLDISDPVKTNKKLKGSVIYIDHFGNMITNIRNEQINPDDIVFVDGINIGNLCSSYSSVEEGRMLCIPGSSGFLEIAINQGSAVDQFDELPTVEISLK